MSEPLEVDVELEEERKRPESKIFPHKKFNDPVEYLDDALTELEKGPLIQRYAFCALASMIGVLLLIVESMVIDLMGLMQPQQYEWFFLATIFLFGLFSHFNHKMTETGKTVSLAVARSDMVIHMYDTIRDNVLGQVSRGLEEAIEEIFNKHEETETDESGTGESDETKSNVE